MIPYGRHFVDEDDIQAVLAVLRHGLLTQGPKIAEFEEALAHYVGAKYAVAVSSGTAALHLACIAGGLTQGDSVVTSCNSFIASANCGLYVGASPCFTDIDPETLNMDPDHLAVQLSINKKAKAIIPVHFAGLPCNMVKIRQMADRHGAVVIEDASHALGATYPDGSKVGNCSYSDMTVFSFHPVKLIAAGEGGMITTNDEKLYRRLLRLRSHGINKADYEFINVEDAFAEGYLNPWYYEMQELGYNYRITDIQAALSLSQLSKLDRFLARRREIVSAYDQGFAGVPSLTPTQLSGRSHSAHHLYVVRIDFREAGMSRHEFMKELAELGIGTQVHYIPIHYHPYYQNMGFKRGDFPVAERYYEQALTLPLFYALPADRVDFISSAVKGTLNKKQPTTAQQAIDK